jgi:hypothetical protein
MKTIPLVLLFVFLMSLSCSSEIYLPKSYDTRLIPFDEIIILKNDYSYIIPFNKTPGHNEIRYMVKDTVPAIEPTFSFIREELGNHGFKSTVWNSAPEIDDHSIYLTYQDYWRWDFKRYMHMMVICIFKPNNELIFKVVSHSSPKGFHNFPTPQKQIPLMIDKLSKHLEQANLLL